ncbi:hypothetical protein RRG08_056821 [Elysia crispata]|uniref:Uncharacterized protein n=1 Tax=Elysia crispata TaxID=231223 RepID=A0AAE1ABH1_9GAST|nr:hypothetical protein RRG08_056821 [Elysia crispata]
MLRGTREPVNAECNEENLEFRTRSAPGPVPSCYKEQHRNVVTSGRFYKTGRTLAIFARAGLALTPLPCACYKRKPGGGISELQSLPCNSSILLGAHGSQTCLWGASTDALIHLHRHEDRLLTEYKAANFQNNTSDTDKIELSSTVQVLQQRSCKIS